MLKEIDNKGFLGLHGQGINLWEPFNIHAPAGHEY